MTKMNNFARTTVALVAAMFFSAGLLVSGMCNPSNVVGFLDITGAWNPSLGLVMVGAILPNFLFYKFFISKKSQPILDQTFHLPQKKKLDSSLIFGALIFGAGWGLSGYCPGPAILSLGAMHAQKDVLVFCFGMILGILLYAKTKKQSARNI